MKTKFFRVAVEGATTDGRAIDRRWLEEMAATYNRETYAARVNMEHIRGITAEPPFQSLGDVISLKTGEIELEIGGKTEKRLALFAELDVLDPLVQMNRKGQKLYTSIEVNPNFAASGKAYLMGLAVTDSPASLGTEVLAFAATQGEKNPFTARKQVPGNLFTAAEPAEIELIESAANPDPTGIFGSIKAMLDKFGGGQPQSEEAPVTPPAPLQPALQPAGAQPGAEAAAFAALGAMIGQMAAEMEKLATQTGALVTALSGEVAALKTTVEATPANGFVTRPSATGGNGAQRTDC